MWIMTPFGILMPAAIPEDVDQAPELLQIRARDRRALIYLRDNYMHGELGKIKHTPSFDYQYRAYADRLHFADAISRMIVEIDYEKFKPESKWRDLHDLYNRIWGVVFDHYGASAAIPKPKTRKGAK